MKYSQRVKQHGMQKQAVIKRADGKIAHSQKSSNRIKPDPGMMSGSITAAVKKNNDLLQCLSQKLFIYTNLVFALIWKPAQQSRHGSASSRNSHRSLELHTQTSETTMCCLWTRAEAQQELSAQLAQHMQKSPGNKFSNLFLRTKSIFQLSVSKQH